MSKSRARRKREAAAAAAQVVQPSATMRDEAASNEILTSSPSYIRELADGLPRNDDEAIESDAMRVAAPTETAAPAEVAPASSETLDRTSATPVESRTSVTDDDALLASDFPSTPADAPSVAVDTDDEIAQLERRLAGGHSRSPATTRNMLAAVGIVAIAVVGSRLAVRSGVTSAAASVASVTARIAKIEKPAPAVAVVEAPAAPVAAPIEAPAAEVAAPQTADDALASDAVTAQPTEALATLLRGAVEARNRGVLAATSGMLAWIDAGGHDAQSVAQFAYWLGRRGNAQLAEQWAERATVLDPRNQTAWYVLGAMRLEDPTQRRAAVVDALRHCAELPGPFVAECRGPLSTGGALR